MRGFALLAVLASVACGSDDPKVDTTTDNDPPGDQDEGPGAISVAIDPASITIPEGSTGTVAITVTRTGAFADANVTFNLADVPSGVAADITGEVLTLRVPFFTQNRTGMVTLTATANGRSAFAKLTLTVAPPTPIDVAGHLVAFDTGLPLVPHDLNQIEVAVWSRGATDPIVVHATDGSFAFDDVVPPYDLRLTVDVAPRSRELLLGLSRANPTVVYYGYAPQRVGVATHAFSIQASDPDAVGYDDLAYAVVCGSGAESLGLGNGVTAYPTGPLGDGATTCGASALAFGPSGALPVSYASLFTASETVDLTDGGSTDLSFAASAANNHTLAVTLTPAASLSPFVDLRWLPDDLRTVSYANTILVEPLTQVVMPNDPTIATGICVSAVSGSNGAFNPLLGGGSTVCRLTPESLTQLDFGTLAGPTAPGDPANTVGRTAVAFHAAAGFGGYIIDTLTAPQEELMVFTNGQLTSQVLSRHDLPFQSGSDYAWQSFTLDGVTSIDAFVSTDVTMHGFLARQSGYGLSAPQTFRTN